MLARQFVERHRPPARIRYQVDLSCRVNGQSVEIFETRPAPDTRETRLEQAVAKATFVKKSGTWKMYWQRADLKWHRYEPSPEVESLEEALRIVGDDAYACFFG